jgi:hypothetical protein
MRQARLIASLILLASLAGCGDGLKRVHVQGKVTALSQPIDNAVVSFMPLGATKGEGGIARSDREGNFSLTGSRRGDKGVVPGEYKIRVSRLVTRNGALLDPAATEADNPGSYDSVPRPYSSGDSPLKATVPEEGGPITIDIPVKLLGRK